MMCLSVKATGTNVSATWHG